MYKNRLLRCALVFGLIFSLCFSLYSAYAIEVNPEQNKMVETQGANADSGIKVDGDVNRGESEPQDDSEVAREGFDRPNNSDNSKKDSKENKDSKGTLEVGEESFNEPVGAPADFDLSTINTIAKDKDGNYYGVKTYGNSFDTTISKPFYKITEEQYDQVANDCFMVFKRQDGKPFEIPSAEICTNGIESPQPRGDKAGPIFTEVQFKHHMAYRLGFILNNNPTRLNSQKDLTWSIKLKKDWVIEPCSEFSSNSNPDYAYVFFNVVLDGDGHKIYRNDDNDKGIFFFGYGNEGNSGIPVKTATLKNITIDGSDKYFGIAVTSKGILNLKNVKIQNCVADSNHLQYGGAIKLRDGAKLTMDDSTIIKDCKAAAGGGGYSTIK